MGYVLLEKNYFRKRNCNLKKKEEEKGVTEKEEEKKHEWREGRKYIWSRELKEIRQV